MPDSQIFNLLRFCCSVLLMQKCNIRLENSERKNSCLESTAEGFSHGILPVSPLFHNVGKLKVLRKFPVFTCSQSDFVFHRIIGWKRPLRSSSPTINPTPPCLINHIPKCHIYTFFKHLQGWGLNHPPGQPVPMPDHSFSKEFFPNTQSKPPLTQLKAIASRPITS